jgi:hypothetical protein
MSTNKSPEEYRRLAEKFREAARTVSAENERTDLLARAKIFDLIAEHRRHHPALNDRLAHWR